MTFQEQLQDVLILKKQADEYRDQDDNNHARWCRMFDNVNKKIYVIA